MFRTITKCRQPKGAYLEHRVRTRVRFQEVDALRIVWHGHYLSYFEDARVAFGRKYGLSYEAFREAGLTAPIAHVACDYLGPARHDEELEVLIRLVRSPGAKLDFYYEIRRIEGGKLLVRGRTLQTLTDADGQLVLTVPPFLREFYSRWADQMVADG